MPKVSRVKRPTKKATKRVVKKKSGGVLDRLDTMSVEDVGYKINLYGRSGTGKTTFWSSFPKPIMVMICSGGVGSGELRSVPLAARKQIKSVALESSSEVGELVEYAKESGEFSTIVLDHASGLQDLILKEVLDLDEIPAQLSWGIAQQQDWGQVAVQMKERLRQILNLDQHVVIVAQERDFTPSDDSDVILPYVASALTPSVVGWLNPACDYICQTFKRPKRVTKTTKLGGKTKERVVETGEVEYCLRVAPDATYTTKFRLPKGTKYPDCIIDPSFEDIDNLIKGGK